MREAGMQMGQPPAPDVIEKAKKLAAEKGLDAEAVNAFITRMASGGGRGGGGGGGGRGEGGGRGGNRGNTFTNTVTTRTVYRVVGDPNAEEKKLEAVNVKLGVSDGFNTEVLEGLGEADTLVTAIVMPGAAAAAASAPGGMNNPFKAVAEAASAAAAVAAACAAAAEPHHFATQPTMAPVVQITDIHKIYESGEVLVHAVRGRVARYPARRIRGPHGRQRLG
jgi:hypothetical protein